MNIDDLQLALVGQREGTVTWQGGACFIISTKSGGRADEIIDTELGAVDTTTGELLETDPSIDEVNTPVWGNRILDEIHSRVTARIQNSA